MIDLCDISSVQGHIDFRRMANEPAGGPDGAPMKGVYIQSSRYSSTPELTFLKYRDAAMKEGLLVGAYHFCWQGGDPEKQMEFFFNACHGLGQKSGELPPMIDWEFCKPPLGQIDCVDWLIKASAHAESLWYPENQKLLLNGPRARKPIIYTFPYFAGNHQPELSQSGMNRYPLCLASYKDKPWYPKEGEAPVHPVPKPWTTATMCQYSGNNGLSVPGVHGACDRDVFLGSTSDFEQFCGIFKTHEPLEYEVKE